MDAMTDRPDYTAIEITTITLREAVMKRPQMYFRTYAPAQWQSAARECGALRQRMRPCGDDKAGPLLRYRLSVIRTTPTTTFTAEFSVRSPKRRAMFAFDRARYLNTTNSATPSKIRNTPTARKIVTW
jgi:hypothetical protein